MADGVKCCICSHYIFGSDRCTVYPRKIPIDVLVQNKNCTKYEKKKVKDDYSYPVAAKGR